MGYSVGFRDGRWIGYAVPAECDHPDCHTMIDHGMGYECEEHIQYVYLLDGKPVSGDGEWDDEQEIEGDGCHLYFCEVHRYEIDTHDDIQPKPDHPRWMYWVLNHESWETWREENPETVEAWREAIKDFEPDTELVEELEAS